MAWLHRLSLTRDRDSSKSNTEHQLEPKQWHSHPTTSYNRRIEVPAVKDSRSETSHDMMHNAFRNPISQGGRRSPLRFPYTTDDEKGTEGGILAPAPDPLTRAFNEALKPYLDRLELLQASLEDAIAQVQQLEKERSKMTAWIDKRGLRPDLPFSILTTLSGASQSAIKLSSQLDRKISMLNYSLHHLADSLAAPLPVSTVTSALAVLLPTIDHLSALEGGSPLAFEATIKLAGNTNSHLNGQEDDADRKHVAKFYTMLDKQMLAIVRVRLNLDPEWDVAHDMVRLEKTATFLRSEIALDKYFEDARKAMEEDVRVHAGEAAAAFSDDSR